MIYVFSPRKGPPVLPFKCLTMSPKLKDTKPNKINIKQVELLYVYFREVLLFQVDYYIEATDADNHAVREAACACIAELGAKVSESFFQYCFAFRH